MLYFSITIQNDENDVRLDRLLKRYYLGLNQGVIEKSLRNKLIRVDGKKTASNYRLKAGEVVEIAEVLAKFKEVESKPVAKIDDAKIKQFENSIIYTDPDIIVLNKPAGLATQGGSKIRISVDDYLDYLRFGYEHKPKLVHRLDKETSGLLLIARNSFTASSMANKFKDHTINKVYLALVIGVPKAKSGTIKEPISAKPNEPKENAETIYKVISSKGGFSLVEFRPITGRMHQIRIHAAHSLGTPIVGDKKYGGDVDGVNANNLHLHAAELFIDNFRGKRHHFTAPLPQHMLTRLNALNIRV
jgi:23S rRNA pseudouridine955/2504/2580 synthase